MKHRYTLLSLLLLVAVAGCQPELPQINPPDSYYRGNMSQEFEGFWNGMNNNYLFWDIDPTDWDGVYRRYKPLFATLKADEKGIERAYAYYKEMTAQLVDSHYTLLSLDDDYPDIRPAVSRVKKRPNYHEPIPVEHYAGIVFNNYLNRNGVIGFPEDSSKILVAGKVKKTNVLYFRFPEFSLKEWYTEGPASAKAVIQYVFDELRKPDLDGMLIDLRGNRGGAVDDLNFLMGHLADKRYVYGANRAKGGMGRLDYLPWVEASVYPPPGATAFAKPVVVLVDMHSVSMAEATAMAVKALPTGKGKVVGERTWGGMGPLTDNATYNGGQFSTPFLIKLVYTSSMMFRFKNGINYEGVGFPPDIEANYDGQALRNGKDTQLETAISQIH